LRKKEKVEASTPTKKKKGKLIPRGLFSPFYPCNKREKRERKKKGRRGVSLPWEEKGAEKI